MKWHGYILEECVKKITEGTDLKVEYKNTTVLELMIRLYNLDNIKWILEQGVKVNITASHPDKPKLLSLFLIESARHINNILRSKTTAKKIKLQDDILKLFVKCGANLKEEDKYFSVLFYAIRGNMSSESIRYIIEKGGVDVNRLSHFGTNALHFTAENPYYGGIEECNIARKNQQKIAEILLEKGLRMFPHNNNMNDNTPKDTITSVVTEIKLRTKPESKPNKEPNKYNYKEKHHLSYLLETIMDQKDGWKRLDILKVLIIDDPKTILNYLSNKNKALTKSDVDTKNRDDIGFYFKTICDAVKEILKENKLSNEDKTYLATTIFTVNGKSGSLLSLAIFNNKYPIFKELCDKVKLPSTDLSGNNVFNAIHNARLYDPSPYQKEIYPDRKNRKDYTTLAYDIFLNKNKKSLSSTSGTTTDTKKYKDLVKAIKNGKAGPPRKKIIRAIT